MFGGANRFKRLEKKCVDMDKDWHRYISGTDKIFVINCYGFQVLFISYIHLVIQFFLGDSNLTGRQKGHK